MSLTLHIPEPWEHLIYELSNGGVDMQVNTSNMKSRPLFRGASKTPIVSSKTRYHSSSYSG